MAILRENSVKMRRFYPLIGRYKSECLRIPRQLEHGRTDKRIPTADPVVARRSKNACEDEIRPLSLACREGLKATEGELSDPAEQDEKNRKKFHRAVRTFVQKKITSTWVSIFAGLPGLGRLAHERDSRRIR
ncbi:hypothetical protein Pla8534_27340 [Lignipirellula cremea]|uniref:Uncharacterized protein n=1 Tax=Lignipirellula cremea TaxID=2528010 RepID=A0A518DSV5_9BACT|nr:hypothetical protein Pla8534_27340 [Lignipirellula cremea]